MTTSTSTPTHPVGSSGTWLRRAGVPEEYADVPNVIAIFVRTAWILHRDAFIESAAEGNTTYVTSRILVALLSNVEPDAIIRALSKGDGNLDTILN